ncbi:hypothetical protein [Bradyrhizobium sp. CSS354]|uniref:hypothetical protein n=1 Tax=Bradyrhizobium sp. CSS354 TaxID=2699172 RepID=UPI0023AF88B9|nr:hypothetical protein [Bradyrhizobium sp. CSS354]MDE5465218.1 hypothetical protein [Bradyrhizobium sp. CSS354]
MMSRLFPSAFLLPVILVGLSACGEKEVASKRSSEAENQIKADADLMRDINRASAELERRLTDAVRAENGVVIIHDPIMGKFFSFVLSPNSPWVLSCGAGLSVVFGTSVSGHEGSAGNDVEIRLAYSTVDEKDCAVLGPRLGKRLNTIFREAASAQ